MFKLSRRPLFFEVATKLLTSWRVLVPYTHPRNTRVSISNCQIYNFQHYQTPLNNNITIQRQNYSMHNSILKTHLSSHRASNTLHHQKQYIIYIQRLKRDTYYTIAQQFYKKKKEKMKVSIQHASHTNLCVTNDISFPSRIITHVIQYTCNIIHSARQTSARQVKKRLNVKELAVTLKCDPNLFILYETNPMCHNIICHHLERALHVQCVHTCSM